MSTMQKVKKLRNLEGQKLEKMTAALHAMAIGDKRGELVARGELVIIEREMGIVERDIA